MTDVKPCPNCGSQALYRSAGISAGGGHAPNFLPGLGTFWTGGKFDLVVCKECGLTRFFARSDALEKLPGSPKWKRL